MQISNIVKFYLAVALSQFAFHIPILQVFYLSNFLSVLQIATLGVIWTVTKLILEVPSSILADTWSRKKVICISSVLSLLQIITLIFATQYGFFILASFFAGAAAAFMSGTDVAYFYDALKFERKEKSFDKLWAKQEIYNQVPFIISFVAAGLLYSINAKLPFVLAAMFALLSLIIFSLLTEPIRSRNVSISNPFLHLRESIKYIFSKRKIRTILLFVILFTISSDISYNYAQIYLTSISVPVLWFGVIYTVKSLLVTISSNFAPCLRRKTSYKFMFGFELISITVLLLLLGVTYNTLFGAILLMLLAIPHGFFIINKSSYIHSNIPSIKRATLDSTISLLVSCLFIFVELFVGWFSDLYSIHLSFLVIGCLLLIYCIYFFTRRT